jgi:hypothetical protein
VAWVQTYWNMLAAFRTHPDAKSAGPDGRPCDRATVGLLGRRVVRTAYLVHLGKEANKLEEVEAGLEHDPDEVWTAYADPRRDPWRTLVLPALRRMPMAELEELGMHRRSLFAIRAGERLPHPRNRQRLVAAAGAFARERLEEAGVEPPADDLAACATFLLRPNPDR